MIENYFDLEKDLKNKKSKLRGCDLVFIDDKWIYADTLEDIPCNGGDIRPCKKCGESFELGISDFCLGELKGVKNACCGHGDRDRSYICFDNGLVIRGFFVDMGCRRDNRAKDRI